MARPVLRRGLLLITIGLFVSAAGYSMAAEIPVNQRSFLFIQRGALWEQGRGRLARVFRQRVGQPISIEAEEASSLVLSEGAGEIGEDKGASGGRYISHVNLAVYNILIYKSGTYYAWERAYFPFKGSWNHSESFDYKKKYTIIDSPNREEDVGKWIWIRGPAYKLKRGRHRWVFYNYNGGAGLDKIMLVRDDSTFKPKGLGLPMTRPTTMKGELVSGEIKPVGLIKWKRFKFTGKLNGGLIRCFYSTDGGTTWKILPEGGELAGLSRDGVQIKFIFTASPEGYSPIVSDLELSYLVSSDAFLTLENKKLSLRFSKTDGSLYEIINKQSNISYKRREPSPLFRLFGKAETSPSLQELAFSEAKLETYSLKDGKLTLNYVMEGGKIAVKVEVTIGKDEITRWRISISNHTAEDIVEIEFPMFEGIAIGSGDDDELIVPDRTGKRIRNPGAKGMSTVLSYPGTASMDWMDLSDSTGGLYLASYDKRYRDTDLIINSCKGSAVSLAFKKYILLRSGSEWTSPDFIAGIHKEDWHWAADQYRAWAGTWMKKPANPDWLKKVEAVWSVDFPNNAISDYSLVGPVYKKAKSFGTRFLGWWGQMTDVGGDCDTFVYPGPLQGGEKIFKEWLSRYNDRGYRSIFYINAQLWEPSQKKGATYIGNAPVSLLPPDVPIPDADFASRNVSRDFSGAPARYGARWYVMSSSAPGWQKHLEFWALKYIKDYKSAGIYNDQLGAAEVRHGFNSEHSHKDYGVWGKGYVNYLSSLVKHGREINPDMVIASEGASDLYGQYSNLQLWSFVRPDTFPEMFRYTFPDYLLWEYTPSIKGATLAFLLDAKIDLDPNAGKNYLPIIKLRRKFNQFISKAVFRDNIGLSLKGSGVEAKIFRRDDERTKGAIITIYNKDKRSNIRIAVDTRQYAPVRRAFFYGPGDKFGEIKGVRRDDIFEFVAPPFKFSAVLLIDRSEPLIDTTIPYVAAGEVVKVKVTVRNLNPEPFNGEISFVLPKGWSAESKDIGPIKSGQAIEETIPLMVPKGVKPGNHGIYTLVSGKMGKTKRYADVIVVRDIIVDARPTLTLGNKIEVMLTNFTSRDIRGTLRLDLPEGLTANRLKEEFILAAKAQKKLSFTLHGVNVLKKREYCRLKVSYADREETVSIGVQPPMLNLGFEGFFGYGPIYWNILRPQVSDEKVREREQPDTTTFVEGKQSLKLLPGTKLVHTTFARIKPGIKYYFKVWIKRTAHSPTIAAGISFPAGVRLLSGSTNIGRESGGPLNVWEPFETTFAVSPDNRYPGQFLPAHIVLSNGSNATVWFDGMELKEIREKK